MNIEDPEWMRQIEDTIDWGYGCVCILVGLLIGLGLGWIIRTWWT